ncbi:MAG: right-handed parallel beta-helix repeat-containing protein, partial [Planctomycetales bacterium]|nr:right-handed parallel beta-helix repeat-containing protein [Planctomycetales bacterium]
VRLTKSNRFGFLVVILYVLILPCQAEEYYVRKSGDDRYSGKSDRQAFKTIGRALSVARHGDSVFIGAGTYVENAGYDGQVRTHRSGRGQGRWRNGDNDRRGGRGRWDGRQSREGGAGTQSGWLLLYADETGRYTGDRGEVIVQSDNDRYAFEITDAYNTLFYGIGFEANPRYPRSSYGCKISNLDGYAYFLYCSFDGLVESIRNEGDSQLYLSDCQFTTCTRAIHAIETEFVSISDCRFDGCRYPCDAVDSNLSIGSSVFSGIDPVTQEIVPSEGVRVWRSEMSLQSSTFANSICGVQGTDLTSAEVKQCKFLDTTSNACKITGESIALEKCQIENGANGLSLVDSSGDSVQLKDVTVKGMQVGIAATKSDYDFDDITIVENQYGIYQYSGCERMTITSRDDVKFKDNQYAIYTDHGASQNATLELSDVDLTDNFRGLYSNRTRVDLQKCKFAGQINGAYLLDCRSVEIKNCEFNGFERSPDTCKFGLYVQSDDIKIDDCESKHAQYGIYVVNTGSRPPSLKRVHSYKHTVAALYMQGGTWELRNQDRCEFEESPRGLWAKDLDWTIDGIESDGSCDYFIANYSGNCRISDAKISAKHTGIYSENSDQMQIDKSIASGCRNFGIDVRNCGVVEITNSTVQKNGNGIHIQSTKSPYATIKNCRVTYNDSYGILLADCTLDPKVEADIETSNNGYGILVQNRPLSVHSGMKLQVTSNDYGISCVGGSLSLRGMTLRGNQRAVYCDGASIDVEDCSIADADYGILAYPSSVSRVAKSQFSDVGYGIFISAKAGLSGPVLITETSIDNARVYGIYLSGQAGEKLQATVSNSKISSGTNGIMSSLAATYIHNVAMSSLSGAGIYVGSGDSIVRDCAISTKNWAILAYGDHCSVDRCQISDGYGIAMLNGQGTLTTSVINEGVVGLVFVNGNYTALQTTVANATSYGVLCSGANLSLHNSIIESKRFGLYNATGNGIFDHSHNLISAPQPYQNVTPGTAEILKPALFVNSAERDFHLAEASPAINAGMDLISFVTSDIEGNERPSFGAFELGAYEYMKPSGSIRVMAWDETAHSDDRKGLIGKVIGALDNTKSKPLP